MPMKRHCLYLKKLFVEAPERLVPPRHTSKQGQVNYAVTRVIYADTDCA